MVFGCLSASDCIAQIEMLVRIQRFEATLASSSYTLNIILRLTMDYERDVDVPWAIPHMLPPHSPQFVFIVLFSVCTFSIILFFGKFFIFRLCLLFQQCVSVYVRALFYDCSISTAIDYDVPANKSMLAHMDAAINLHIFLTPN